MTQPTAPPARVEVTYRPYRDENGAQHKPRNGVARPCEQLPPRAALRAARCVLRTLRVLQRCWPALSRAAPYSAHPQTWRS